jgi:hypothetical protein
MPSLSTLSRRALVAIGFLTGADAASGKKKGKGSKNRCRRDGRRCKKASERCKRQFCLKTPFTIEARWASTSQDHDAILYVPHQPGTSVPFPYIDYACLAGDTNAGTLYPFAFSSGDVQAGPGAEVVTIQRLLAGRYEFRGRVHGPAQPGDLKVILRNRDGKLVRSWNSPPNPSGAQLLDWHVVDIDGATRSVAASGEAITGLFSTVRADSTYVCPA